jgi:hypothetical protein
MKLISLELLASGRGTIWVNPEAIVCVEPISSERCKLMMIGGNDYDLAGSAESVAALLDETLRPS